MDIRDDAWLSGVLGHGAFRVAPAERVADDAIAEHARRQGRAFYYAKVDAGAIDLVQRLGRYGFFVVDVNVTFELTAPAVPRLAGGAETASITDVDEAMHEDLLQLAGTAFEYSRFHLDPRIPRDIAHRIKREWIRSYLRKERGEALLTAMIGGRAVGFLAVLGADIDGRAHVIDLIAVDRAYRGRGIGRMLVQTFIDRYRSQSVRLQVGTQVANITSIRLYEQLGFALVRAQYVLHMHVGTEARRCG